MEPYGIDFGTRNTAVDCRRGRLSDEGGRTIPSAVAYDSFSPAMRFGVEAIELLKTKGSRTRWSVITSFKTALTREQAVLVRTPLGDKTAMDVLTDYLRHLVQRASVDRKPLLEAAAFSIPVGFPAKARRNLLKAARNAGITVKGLVSESTSAYLSVMGQLGGCERAAVVDWGAGTLDVSVVSIAGGGGAQSIIEESACKGSCLAGDEIDRAIYESFATEARLQGRAIPEFEKLPTPLQCSLLRICELEKIAMSEKGEPADAHVYFEHFADGKLAEFHFSATSLLRITERHRQRLFQIVDEAIADSGVSLDQIDRIMFIGGCTSLIGVREEAGRRYGPKAVIPQSPEWVVAAGALAIADRSASFECLQDFGCVLDDGVFLQLNDHRRFDGKGHDRYVAATDTSGRASLVIASREGSDERMAGAMAVPLQGHVGEPIRITTTLCEDLTVQVQACSTCGIVPEDERSIDIADTRFRFRA
jgi:molecular chaperone DnaK